MRVFPTAGPIRRAPAGLAFADDESPCDHDGQRLDWTGGCDPARTTKSSGPGSSSSPAGGLCGGPATSASTASNGGGGLGGHGGAPSTRRVLSDTDWLSGPASGVVVDVMASPEGGGSRSCPSSPFAAARGVSGDNGHAPAVGIGGAGLICGVLDAAAWKCVQ